MAFVSGFAPSFAGVQVRRGRGAVSHSQQGPSHSARRTVRATATPPPATPPPPPPQGQASAARSIACAASAAGSLNEALTDAAARALAQLVPGASVDVALVFVSARYAVAKAGPRGRESLADVAPSLRSFLPGLRAVFGCTAEGVVGDGKELEDMPSVSITLLRLPGIAVKTFHIMPDDVPSLDASQSEWRRVFGNVKAEEGKPPAFLLLSDPTFSSRGDMKRCLRGLDYAYPGSSAFGSIASAGAGFAKGHMVCTLPRDILGASVSTSLRDSGMVGLALSGDVEVDCFVTQSCRALGPTFEVRKVSEDGMAILDMEEVARPGKSLLSAVGHLKSLMQYSTPTERKLLQNSLHMGFPPSEFDDRVPDRDFLVRRVTGVDVERGAISMSCAIRVGNRVRFVVQEETAAKNLLNKTLQAFKKSELAKSLVGYRSEPLGALVFLDASRGRQLFREPEYETRALTSFAPTVSVSGFFGAGQIAAAQPGDRGVLHNGAGVVAIIRNRSPMDPVNPPDSPPLDPPES